MNRYKQLLTYIRSAVTRNYSEKSINSILDYISTSKQVRQDKMRQRKVYLAFTCRVLRCKLAVPGIRKILLSKMWFLCHRWICYRSSMKPPWRLWKMQKMTDCGLKLTQRYPKVLNWFQVVLHHNFLVNQVLRNAFFVPPLQLGKLYLEREEYGKLQKILRQLHQSCQVNRLLFKQCLTEYALIRLLLLEGGRMFYPCRSHLWVFAWSFK